MIKLGAYTKEELAAELNYNTDKASNITKRLSNLGYQFGTIGKGRTYRIYITGLPQMSVRQFAEKYLGISARFEDRLAHFLYLLFASGNSEQFANMSASSLEWHTYSNNDTIQNWLESLIDCGLLQEENMIEVYYATKKKMLQLADYNGDYTYTQICKEISREEYNKAVKAYSDKMKSYGELNKNPDVANDEAIFNANVAKKDALDGWWAMRKTANYKIIINKNWSHYSELLALLDNFQFENYEKEKSGNLLIDEQKWEERLRRWELEKIEKRKKLEELENKSADYSKDKKVDVETEKGSVKMDIPPAKIRNNDAVDRGEGFRDYLSQLNELYYKTKKGFYEYEEE